MFRTKDTYGNHVYAGRSKASVLDNRDPANKGRILVKHPILGETIWVDYLRQPNQVDVPSIGDVVYLECESGEHEFPVAHGTLTLGYPGKANYPDAFKRNVPSNRGFYTPGGHIIEMDDGLSNPTTTPNDKDLTTNKRGIRLTTKAGNKVHIMEDEINGVQHILLEDIAGNMIKLDTLNKTIELNSVENFNNVVGKDYRLIVVGNILVQCADATVEATSAVIQTTGNVVATVGGTAQLAVTGDAEITAATIKLNGSAGQILTTVTDPVVDTIFGVPTVGVPTVKSG